MILDTDLSTALAILGTIAGTIGVFLLGALAIMLTLFMFGVAIVNLAEVLKARTAQMGLMSRPGWSPTCPGCGFDVTGSEAFCPHCGRRLSAQVP